MANSLNQNIWRSPCCKAVIKKEQGKYYQCVKCGNMYPIIFDIPDLRLMEAPYETKSEELEIVESMTSIFDQGTLERIVEARFQHLDLSHPRTQLAIKARKNASNRARQIRSGLLKTLNQANIPRDYLKNSMLALDIGTGVGVGAFAVAKWCHVIGLDISLPDLVIAKKFLREEGISNVTLVCADSEHLPLPDQQMDLVISRDVIEHVQDQRAYLHQALRVLKSSGYFIFNNCNRYSLKPEPHTGIYGVGFIPRRWQKNYVHWRDPSQSWIGKRLLSIWELRKLLQQEDSIETYHIWPSEDQTEILSYTPDLSHPAGSWLGKLARSSGVFTHLYNSKLGQAFRPFHEIVVRKKAEGGTGNHCV